MADRQLERIKIFKDEPLYGKFVDMVPANSCYSRDIVALRNSDRSLFSFNQQQALTVEGQNEWFEAYKQRVNDIYWVILKKNGTFLGTTRMYNINLEEGVAESGSSIMREEYVLEAPYALESFVLAYDVMFLKLGLKKVITHTRCDNQKVLSSNRRLGALESKEPVYINGVRYVELFITSESYKRDHMNRILDHWARRSKA